MVSRPPCPNDASLVSQVGRLYPSSDDGFASAHASLEPMCFVAPFKTVGEASDCAQKRVIEIAALCRAEPRLQCRRLLIDWLDAHFPVIVAGRADPTQRMLVDLYPERVMPRREALLKPWVDVAYQSALPPRITLSPAEKVMRKSRELSSLRYVTQQVRRALSQKDDTLPAGGTAMLLRAAVCAAELDYYTPTEGVNVDPAERLVIWARTDAEQLAAFNAKKRGAKELRAMLLQLASGAASFDTVARFLYTRELATVHESVKVLQLCQKVMGRHNEDAMVVPHRGFGVHLSQPDVSLALEALGGGSSCPSAKKINAALVNCPQLAEAARRQLTALCQIAVVPHSVIESKRQLTFPRVWTSFCRNACAWKRSSRKRRRDAVAVVGDTDAVCGACGDPVVMLCVNGTLIRDAAGAWTQMCGVCGAVITNAYLRGVVSMCKACYSCAMRNKNSE